MAEKEIFEMMKSVMGGNPEVTSSLMRFHNRNFTSRSEKTTATLPKKIEQLLSGVVTPLKFMEGAGAIYGRKRTSDAMRALCGAVPKGMHWFETDLANFPIVDGRLAIGRGHGELTPSVMLYKMINAILPMNFEERAILFDFILTQGHTISNLDYFFGELGSHEKFVAGSKSSLFSRLSNVFDRVYGANPRSQVSKYVWNSDSLSSHFSSKQDYQSEIDLNGSLVDNHGYVFLIPSRADLVAINYELSCPDDAVEKLSRTINNLMVAGLIPRDFEFLDEELIARLAASLISEVVTPEDEPELRFDYLNSTLVAGFWHPDGLGLSYKLDDMVESSKLKDDAVKLMECITE